jgi:hypothetical protein
MAVRHHRIGVACRWLLVAWIGLPLGALAAPQGTTKVAAGDARFEFLTPSLVRMEYSPSAHFTDAATAVVLKRDWPHVDVSQNTENGWLVVSTGAMTLRYRLQSGAFSAANLRVQWKADGGAHAWHPGQVDDGNLGGLTYSLDNVSARNLPTDGKDRPAPSTTSSPASTCCCRKPNRAC